MFAKVKLSVRLFKMKNGKKEYQKEKKKRTCLVRALNVLSLNMCTNKTRRSYFHLGKKGFNSNITLNSLKLRLIFNFFAKKSLFKTFHQHYKLLILRINAINTRIANQSRSYCIQVYYRV